MTAILARPQARCGGNNTIYVTDQGIKQLSISLKRSDLDLENFLFRFSGEIRKIFQKRLQHLRNKIQIRFLFCFVFHNFPKNKISFGLDRYLIMIKEALRRRLDIIWTFFGAQLSTLV